MWIATRPVSPYFGDHRADVTPVKQTTRHQAAFCATVFRWLVVFTSTITENENIQKVIKQQEKGCSKMEIFRWNLTVQ